MTDYYIDPTASSNGNGTENSPFNSWARVQLQSGNTYLQRAGTSYSGTITLNTSNVTLSSYSTGLAPQVGGLYFSGGSNDSASNLTIQGNGSFGVIFANGAANDSISNSAIAGNYLGALFATGSGANDSLSSDNIYSNRMFGVDIAQGATGTVTNNTIYSNGCHGVEIEGDNSTVTYNNVYGNGTIIGGSSGIHTYTSSPGVNGGNNNDISWNVVQGTLDDGSGDGNGIEIDQWTHGNAVNGNITYQNDGAGIADYDSYDNTFIGNAAFGDERGSVADHGTRAEMYLTNSSQNDGFVYGNTIYNNILDSTNSAATDLFFDSGSADSQNLGSNLLAGYSGNLSASQLSSDTSSYYSWWNTHSIPTGLQGTAHAALEKMVSF